MLPFSSFIFSSWCIFPALFSQTISTVTICWGFSLKIFAVVVHCSSYERKKKQGGHLICCLTLWTIAKTNTHERNCTNGTEYQIRRTPSNANRLLIFVEIEQHLTKHVDRNQENLCAQGPHLLSKGDKQDSCWYLRLLEGGGGGGVKRVPK